MESESSFSGSDFHERPSEHGARAPLKFVLTQAFFVVF